MLPPNFIWPQPFVNPKNVWPQKSFAPQICLTPNVCWPLTSFKPKNYWPPKNVDPKHFLTQTFVYTPEKHFLFFGKKFWSIFSFQAILSTVRHQFLSLKFEYDPIGVCWAIPILLFWGGISFEVIFISRICKIWYGHQSISLKFEYDPMIYWGCLPFDVIFILRMCKIWFGYLSLSLNLGKIQYAVADIFHF